MKYGQGLKYKINEIDKYILEKESQGKKAYIVDSDACLYMIPLDKYNKNYDMFLKGNIGKNGQEEQIRQIENRDNNTIYLIKNKEMKLNWQTPTKIIEYIRNNLKKVGKVNIYEIYE